MESVDVALSETVGFTCDRLHFLKRTLCFFFPHLDFGDIIISMQNIQCTYSSAGTLENWFTISKCWCSRRFKEIVAKFFLVKLWLYNILYSI